MGGAGYIMPSGPMTKVGIIGGGAVGGGGGAAAPGVNSVAPTLNLNSLAVAESFVAGFFSSAAAGAGAGAGAGAAFFAPSFLPRPGGGALVWRTTPLNRSSSSRVSPMSCPRSSARWTLSVRAPSISRAIFSASARCWGVSAEASKAVV